MDATLTADIASHYGRADLLQTIESALRAAGKSPDSIVPDDLAPLDQFHTRGRQATLDLARLADLTGREAVLDLGGGLGGPARTLASSLGCHVTVLDLTPEFCRAGEELTRWLGLGDRVAFRVGDALEAPFPDGSFDLVWTQHSSMNIPDKPRLYAEAHRLLRPGGRLAIHEIAGSPGEPHDYPVPWASTRELSFLLPEADLRATIREAGFEERAWVDLTESSLAWVVERVAAWGAAPVGLHALLGPGAIKAFDNLRRGLAAGRLRVIEAVFVRAG
jgi:MPBQ/MSBQ methyltransferase